MSVTVTYYCPRCGTLAAVERDGYLDDKSVTPYPLDGWTYDRAAAVFGRDGRSNDTVETIDATDTSETITNKTTAIDESDGVRFVCGEPTDGVTWKTGPELPDGVDPDDLPDDVVVADEAADPGCGEPFYLSFVTFDDGREMTADTEAERVRLAEPRGPSAPSGPTGPNGPDTSDGGFY